MFYYVFLSVCFSLQHSLTPPPLTTIPRYYLNGSDAFRLKLWVGDGMGDAIDGMEEGSVAEELAHMQVV